MFYHRHIIHTLVSINPPSFPYSHFLLQVPSTTLTYSTSSDRIVDPRRCHSSPSAIPANLNGYSSYYRDVFGHGRSLRTWLADEEERYGVAVQEQLELIKKWGPKDDAVDP